MTRIVFERAESSSPVYSSASSPATAAMPQRVALRERDRDEPRADQLAELLRDELEQRVEVELGDEDVHHLVQRLELRRPARRRLVEARVLDRDRGLGGEQDDRRLVLLVEVGAARLLGEVEVAVDDAAQADRDTEEGLHRRVVRREADRARILVEVVEAQRLRLADEDAEDAAPAGRSPIAVARLLVDARRDEALELRRRTDRGRRAPRTARR